MTAAAWDPVFGSVRPAASESPREATQQVFALLAGSEGRPHRIDWGGACDALGTRLPADYQELCERFGPGAYWDVVVAAPGPGSPLDLIEFAAEAAEMQRSLEPNRARRYPIYPEPSGALTWGRTPNAVHLAWITEGDPDSWSVAIIDRGNSAFEHVYWIFEGSMSQLLLDVLTGDLEDVYILVDPAATPRVSFEPY